jgi:hypothetical protein
VKVASQIAVGIGKFLPMVGYIRLKRIDAMQTIPSSRKPSVSVTDLELLHEGLGALIAHYLISEERWVARCIALGVSRQLRLIAEHPALPDPALQAL